MPDPQPEYVTSRPRRRTERKSRPTICASTLPLGGRTAPAAPRFVEALGAMAGVVVRTDGPPERWGYAAALGGRPYPTATLPYGWRDALSELADVPIQWPTTPYDWRRALSWRLPAQWRPVRARRSQRQPVHRGRRAPRRHPARVTRAARIRATGADPPGPEPAPTLDGDVLDAAAVHDALVRGAHGEHDSGTVTLVSRAVRS